jgi:hypothetical protein
MGANYVIIPLIVFGAILKKKSILNPKLNTSYSSVSIRILNFLIGLALLKFMSNIYIIFECLYYQSAYSSLNEYVSAKKNNQLNIYVSVIGAPFDYTSLIARDVI